jgi:hypothetical protein
MGQGKCRRTARLKVSGGHGTHWARGAKRARRRPQGGAQRGLHKWSVLGVKLYCYNQTEDGFGKSAKNAFFHVFGPYSPMIVIGL